MQSFATFAALALLGQAANLEGEADMDKESPADKVTIQKIDPWEQCFRP